MKYKILWITLCFNEMDILPFVRRYWERIGCDVLVLDNGSVDGSIEYISSLPYAKVSHFETTGQNDIVQKSIKEQAYLDNKDAYDIIIISDMDEIFYFENSKKVFEEFITGGYNCMVTPIFSLCEDFRPEPEKGRLLHQQCHKFYRQKMNHMQGFEKVSKISIFNCRKTDKIEMSVGQHYVSTLPSMRIMLSNEGFCLHIDKGFGKSYRYTVKHKMNDNLSEENKKYGMCIEYGDSYEKMEREYENNQKNSFDINEIF